jgi:chorismate--pyruvate lyase
MRRMHAQTPNIATSNAAWLDARALAKQDVPDVIRGWLTYSTLLSARMRELFGSAYALHVLREHVTTECADATARLGVGDRTTLLREIEIVNGETRAMFAQTWMPTSTLQSQAWLRELGRRSLGETLAQAGSVERSPLEFARLSGPDALLARAMPDAPRDTVLWARRSVFAIAGAPILVTEVFLPELEQWPAC